MRESLLVMLYPNIKVEGGWEGWLDTFCPKSAVGHPPSNQFCGYKTSPRMSFMKYAYGFLTFFVFMPPPLLFCQSNIYTFISQS